MTKFQLLPTPLGAQVPLKRHPSPRLLPEKLFLRPTPYLWTARLYPPLLCQRFPKLQKGGVLVNESLWETQKRMKDQCALRSKLSRF